MNYTKKIIESYKITLYIFIFFSFCILCKFKMSFGIEKTVCNRRSGNPMEAQTLLKMNFFLKVNNGGKFFFLKNEKLKN